MEAEQVIEQFTAFESDQGKKIWDLTAAKGYEENNVTIVKDFVVRFYRKGLTLAQMNALKDKDRINSTLKAACGRIVAIDTQKSDFFTEGKTYITTPYGEKLVTSDLTYSSDKKKIYTEAEYVLTRNDSVIRGKGLEAEPDLSVIILKNNRILIREDDKTKK